MPASPACSSRMKRSSCSRGCPACRRWGSGCSAGRSWRRIRARPPAPGGARSRRASAGRRWRSARCAARAGKRSCSSDSCRYSGRKSWPHCDTQCASSMANSAIRDCSSSSSMRGMTSRSGATYSRSSSPARSARSAAAACSAHPAWNSGRRRARRAAASAATWSCISAISGETTSAGALAQQRRHLVAQRLAAAGGHQHQRVAAAGDVRDDLFLRAAEARHGRRRCSGAGGRAQLAGVRQQKHAERRDQENQTDADRR